MGAFVCFTHQSTTAAVLRCAVPCARVSALWPSTPRATSCAVAATGPFLPFRDAATALAVVCLEQGQALLDLSVVTRSLTPTFFSTPPLPLRCCVLLRMFQSNQSATHSL